MIPYRGEGDEVRHLKQSGDVGKVNPIPFHPLDEKSIRDCIGNSDIVINLVGKYYETKNLYLRKNYTYSFVSSSSSPDSKTSTSTSPSASRRSATRWAKRIFSTCRLCSRTSSIVRSGLARRWARLFPSMM